MHGTKLTGEDVDVKCTELSHVIETMSIFMGSQHSTSYSGFRNCVFLTCVFVSSIRNILSTSMKNPWNPSLCFLDCNSNLATSPFLQQKASVNPA